MPAVNFRRLPYSSALLVGGLLLFVLGAGNWIVGSVREKPYAEMAGEELPVARGNAKERLLQPVEDGEESLRIGQAKLEFYRLVGSAGRLMMVLGAGCVLGGIVAGSRFARRAADVATARSS